MTASLCQRLRACAAVALASLAAFCPAVAQSVDVPPVEATRPEGTSAPAAGAPSAEEGGGETPKVILVHADRITATSEGKGVWIIEGDVELLDEDNDTRMYASHCVWDRNENTAVLTENVRVVPKNHTITADRCDVDLDTQVAVLTSSPPNRVHVVSKKEYEGGQPFEPRDEAEEYEYKRWDTDCDRVEYDMDDDRGTATGSIITRSEDGQYTFYGEVMHYEVLENEDELITLPNNPRLETADDENFTCESAVITLHADSDAKDVVLNAPSAHVVANKDKKNGKGAGGASEEAESAGAAAPAPGTAPAPTRTPPAAPPGPRDEGAPEEGGQG